MTAQRICYHATDEAGAEAILATGFALYTYFALHLEDTFFGKGEYVFEVAFPADITQRPDAWQFTTIDRIPPDRIVAHYRLAKTSIIDNKELRRQVLETNRGLRG